MERAGTAPTYTAADVEDLAAAVRRVVRARVSDSHLADDLTQETLARVLSRQPPLEPDALRPYAIVTAKHLVASTRRVDGRHADAAHRLVDLRAVELPEDAVLHRDERSSMGRAISALSERDREVLLSHEVDDVTTKELAEGAGTTPGAIAVRLAAARAKLRVEYVLSHRREAPLPRECRSVLVALSAGDRRRQRALGADGHLAGCERCSSLSEPLLSRSRASAALLPVIALRGALERAGAAVRRHPGPSAAGATAMVVTAGLLYAQTTAGDDQEQLRESPPAVASGETAEPPPGEPAPGAQGLVSIGAEPLGAIPGAQVAELVGRTVEVRGAAVAAVPAPEGFWLDDGSGDRSWVQMATTGESGVAIQPGMRVTFSGTLVATPPDHPARVGLAPEEGADELLARGVHIEVASVEVAVD